MESVNIQDTMGALFVGALVTMTLYGITTLQTYIYYMSFPKDGILMKCLVAFIWILDTLHVILMCHSLHYYLITEFGNLIAHTEGTWSLVASIGINVIIALIVQSFFTQRIHTISPANKKWWISGIIGFTVVVHFAFGMETVVLIFIKKKFSRLKEIRMVAALPFGVFVVLSDVFIALALCILLHSNRSDFEDTNSLINKLIVYAINRCLLTVAMTIVEVVVFVVVPNSFYSFAIDFVIGKLYANSLLAALNARKSLGNENERRNDSRSTELSTSFQLASAVADSEAPTSHIRVRSRARWEEGSVDGEAIDLDVLDSKERGNTSVSVL
ncbi:hypothetical protein BDQ17DRAFT_187197 [Cyathus striatus]|nr:hypothetical protein BDQ17DRAFT_187197 [Cyathus striatus]